MHLGREIVLGLVVAALAFADVPEGLETWQPWTTVYAALLVAAVVVRGRTRPIGAVVALAALAVLAVGAQVAGSAGEVPFGQVLVVALLLADAARVVAARTAVAFAVAAAVVAGLTESLADARGADDVALVALIWGSVVASAIARRAWSERQSALAEQVRAEERERIARDLHDVVAHHVSAIAMVAEGARSVGSPEVTTRALSSIHESAVATLDEMRRMVAILRDHDRATTPMRLVDLADHLDTVAHLDPVAHLDRTEPNARAARPSVRVHIADDVGDPPAAVVTAIHRIVQEAVTNARRHAHGATHVVVDIETTTGLDTDWGAREVGSMVRGLRVSIVDDGVDAAGRWSGGGNGLRGMRERAELLGGRLRSGRRPSGGWEVVAVLPLDDGSLASRPERNSNVRFDEIGDGSARGPA